MCFCVGTLKDVKVVEYEGCMDTEVFNVSLPCWLNVPCKSFEVADYGHPVHSFAFEDDVLIVKMKDNDSVYKCTLSIKNDIVLCL